MLLVYVSLTIEMILWKRSRLQPWHYLLSQTLKSIVATIIFSQIIRDARVTTTGKVLRGIVIAAGFWGALMYALYVFRIARRKRGAFDYISSPEATLLEPVNTASKLKISRPALITILDWLNTEPQSIHSLPAPYSEFVLWLLYMAKYAISFPCFMLFILASERLPGEDFTKQAERQTTISQSWNYLPPITSDTYRDSLGSAEASAYVGNGEITIDTVNSRLSRAPPKRGLSLDRDSHNLVSSRPLGPQFLCFVSSGFDPALETAYTTRRIDDVGHSAASVDYVFVSYTRQQFFSQIPNDPSFSTADRTRFQSATERDKATLIKFAIAATQEAGASAFWIDFECIKPDEQDRTDHNIEEVYRICDIMRSSHSLAIIVGPGLDASKNHVSNTPRSQWLLDWGRRLWTVPEALLCPSEHRISIYSVGEEVPEKVAKRNLPARVWDDAGMLRQLMDHYEGSLRLSQIELVSIALESLQHRQTQHRNNGDVAYALMGLLRLRPNVNKTDTGFEAFARLSLANDSNMLLERLICLHSRLNNAPWHDMSDQWDTRLWQIEPLCQISGLGGNDTVTVGSASGAHIEWTSLSAVDFTISKGILGMSWLRAISRLFLSALIACGLVALGFTDHNTESPVSAMAIATVIAIIAALVALPIPFILSRHVRRKFSATQARLFGIEGRANLGRVEALIFGADCGRLQWSPDSLVSEDRGDDEGEEAENAMDHASASTQRTLYTLVDTLTCTATCFRAVSPPQTLFVCAREHGRQRAILCNYDPAQRMFSKASVVRLSGAVMPRMQALESFRLCITPAPPAPAYIDIDERVDIPDISELQEHV